MKYKFNSARLKRARDKKVDKWYKNKNKLTCAIIAASVVITAVIFAIARPYAVAARGNTGFGGELLLWLIPFCVWAAFENILLEKKVRKKPLYKNNGNHFVRIKEITEIKEIA